MKWLTKLPFYFKGGIYVFTMLETYVAGLSLLTTVFFEAIAVSWIYGKKNIYTKWQATESRNKFSNIRKMY